MLTYDEIPADRRTLGDACGRLDGYNGVLGVALAQWMARDDSRAEPEVRQAANPAMDMIDAMPPRPTCCRSRLVGEIRASDDQTAARVDELLARCKEDPR